MQIEFNNFEDYLDVISKTKSVFKLKSFSGIFLESYFRKTKNRVFSSINRVILVKALQEFIFEI